MKKDVTKKKNKKKKYFKLKAKKTVYAQKY